MKALGIMAAMVIVFTGLACDKNVTGTGNNSPTGGSGNDIWSIPLKDVLDGGPGKDGIPALLDPIIIQAEDAEYLDEDDLILGFVQGSEAIAYPHKILDWHEIINDGVGEVYISVTYCPLTGTGIGWNRVIDGQLTTFGVSGLLYNSNLIPYDRSSNSNWSQILMECVNGEHLGQSIETYPLVETTWNTWKKMYPDTRVVSTETGHSRDYGRYPYGDYRTNDFFLIFPVGHTDDRLANKDRVHGVVNSGNTRIYPLSAFVDSVSLIQENIGSRSLVVAGNASDNFVVSYFNGLDDGTSLSFVPVQDQYPVIMRDQEGNSWDVFGTAVAGPRMGARLEHARSFMGYWFSFAAFYPGLSIYDPG